MLTTYNQRRAGMTLMATVMSMGLSGILLATMGSMFFFSARSFVSLDNAITLETQDRMAIARLTKEVRQAEQVLTATRWMLAIKSDTRYVAFVFIEGRLLRVAQTFTPGMQFPQSVNPEVMLEGVDSFEFESLQRIPGTNGVYTLMPASSPDRCKVIRFKWQSSRDVLGQTAATSTFESAHVVLRNLNLE